MLPSGRFEPNLRKLAWASGAWSSTSSATAMLQLLLQLLQGQGCCNGCCKNFCLGTSGCFPTAKAPKRTNSVAGNASDGRLVSHKGEDGPAAPRPHGKKLGPRGRAWAQRHTHGTHMNVAHTWHGFQDPRHRFQDPEHDCWLFVCTLHFVSRV